ncbi:MAG: MaoC family dehydratase N-terminal domain-containing protein [Acetobacteraceae bacterium]|nr:MaoC family dehydratase N-terminal domain-containing protein [Acetobacteraceae bacterium]
MSAADAPTLLGQGYHWQDLAVGQRFRSFRRTVTETDLIGFVTLTGMLEPLFIDATEAGALGPRPIPAALTHAIIEGLVLGPMARGTGLALLELHLRPLAPVRVGDTIGAEVTIAAIRPASRGNRAVVESAIAVINQHGEQVMDYTVKRLIAGRDRENGTS